jgi:hypothetical protein
MAGAVWNAGTWYYGNANNIYWVSGTWLNGQWNGSPYNYSILDVNNNVITGREKQILSRIGLLNSNMHANNIFTGTYSKVYIDGFTQSSNPLKLSWAKSGNIIYLPSFGFSNPIFKPSTLKPMAILSLDFGGFFAYSYKYSFSFQIGNIVTPGEVYKISFGNVYSISYTVPNTNYNYKNVLNELINSINTDTYLSTSKLIWRQSKNADASIDSIYDNVLNIYYNSHRSNLIPSVTASSILNVPSNNGVSNTLNLTIGSSSGIFTTASKYSISIELQSIGGTSDFSIYYGNPNTPFQTNLNGKKTYTLSLNQTIDQLNYTGFSIQRNLILDGNPTFSILSYNVRRYDTVYSTYTSNIFNTPNNGNSVFNSLIKYPSINGSYSNLINGSTISLSSIDPNLITTFNIKNNELISLNFGNGKFGSFPSLSNVNTNISNNSVWKGGVWNNGYWDSVDSIEFSKISCIGIDSYTWNITLTNINNVDLSSSKYSFVSGENVSVSNIVGLDINNNRVLITNLSKVLSVTPIKIVDNIYQSSITIQILTKYPILRIEKDSGSHTIKVTKTSWLSGFFLNGIFNGVWTYGMVKGYPYITKFLDSHWIDGIFDGGSFKSSQISLNSTQSTGLIQNFVFRDNNIASENKIGTREGFLYNSWMDLYYDDTSMTNIYKNNYIYDQNYQLSISDMNLNGYPTYDVLSSKSYFRNSYDNNISYYSLGSKYQIYTDFLGDGAVFNNSYSNQIPKLGLNKFYELGWTYSQSSNLVISSNTSLKDSNKLFISNINPKAELNRIGIRYAIISDTNVTSPTASKTTVRITNSGSGNDIIKKSNSNYVFIGQFENTARFKDIYYSKSTNIDNQYNVKLFNNIHNNISFKQENDGYYNPNPDWDQTQGLGKQGLTQSNTEPISNDTFTFNYWKIPTSDIYTLGLKIPFILNLGDSYNRHTFVDWGGYHDSSRGGGSVYFKLFGCIEYCLFDNDISVEDNWTILGTTYMELDPNLKYTGSFDTYIKVGVNKYDGSINFDNENIVSGLLNIDNFTYNFTKGDRVRFNVYTIVGPNPRTNNSIDNSVIRHSDIGFNTPTSPYYCNSSNLNKSGTEMVIAFPGTRTYASITFNPTSQNIKLDGFGTTYPATKQNQRILGYPYNNSGYFEVYTSNSVSYIENDKVNISKNRYSLSKIDISSFPYSANVDAILAPINGTFSFNLSNNEISFPGIYSNVLKVGDYISLSASTDKYYFTLTNVDLKTIQTTIVSFAGSSIINNNVTILNTLENLPLLQQDTNFTLNLEDRITIPNIFQLNTPKIYSPNRNIVNYINNLNKSISTNKEYFYNKNIFRFYLENNGDYSILFNNINFYEIDSIPFFNYWSDKNNINTNIEIPYELSMPNIDNTQNIYEIIGNTSLNFTHSVINNGNVSLLNYYLSDYFVFFALIGYNGSDSNYTTYSLANSIITVIGKSSDSLSSIKDKRLFIEDTYSGNVYNYPSNFTGYDSATFSPSLTYSLLMYPTDSVTTTQKSKYILANITNNDLSPLVNLQFNSDFPDITSNSPYTLNVSFAVNTNGVASTTNINPDWGIYVNGASISSSFKYKNLITAGNKSIDLYDTDTNYMGYTISNINSLMQKTYSLIYKPTLTINGNPYSPDFYYVNNYYVKPNAIIASVSTSFTYSPAGTYSYGIENLIYSTTASGRRYATIEWSKNGGPYSFFTTSVSKPPSYNIFNINTDGTIDYSPNFPFDIAGKTYSIRVTTTSYPYVSSLFIPSTYTFSVVYGQ